MKFVVLTSQTSIALTSLLVSKGDDPSVFEISTSFLQVFSKSAGGIPNIVYPNPFIKIRYWKIIIYVNKITIITNK